MSGSQKDINRIKKPMNDDFLDVRNSEGMPGLVDSTVALDFLVTAKTAIKDCAIALTEIRSPRVRIVLRDHLDSAIHMHTEITNLMMRKGWFKPYHVTEQFEIDQISSQTALQIAGLNLFPGDTSRMGTFATPHH